MLHYLTKSTLLFWKKGYVLLDPIQNSCHVIPVKRSSRPANRFFLGGGYLNRPHCLLSLSFSHSHLSRGSAYWTHSNPARFHGNARRSTCRRGGQRGVGAGVRAVVHIQPMSCSPCCAQCTLPAVLNSPQNKVKNTPPHSFLFSVSHFHYLRLIWWCQVHREPYDFPTHLVYWNSITFKRNRKWICVCVQYVSCYVSVLSSSTHAN